MTIADTFLDLMESPLFRITVVWHPDFKDGSAIADAIYDHYRGEVYRSVIPTVGIDVDFRFAPEPESGHPRPIETRRDRLRCIVVLVDDRMTQAVALGTWKPYLDALAAAESSSATFILPVAISKGALRCGFVKKENYIRPYEWPAVSSKRDFHQRVMLELNQEIYRRLSVWAAAAEDPATAFPPATAQSTDPLTVFISYSRRDGSELADRAHKLMADANARLRAHTFLDRRDIGGGDRFQEAIEKAIGCAAVLVIQTDSYSSREWCRFEVLSARRPEVPIVVFNALADRELRAFPYLGNVPVITAWARPDGSGPAYDVDQRLDEAITTLLDEYVRSTYWRVHRRAFDAMIPGALLLPRAPDLLALVHRSPPPSTVIHPDPPLGRAESKVLLDLVPALRLETPMTLLINSTGLVS